MRAASATAALLAWLAATGAVAQGVREPVLRQVSAPHNYYWRELYLPQLTVGPSGASFMPSGDELVYSMGGSLWRQRIGSPAATELTHPAGAYDYQPDVAADGRRVVFTRYDGNAMELWELDLSSGRERALTRNGAVNVEPRISPDGRRLAWVSTQREGMFAIFIADFGADGLANAGPLLPLRRSTVDRYYYGAIDHSINPAWSPDGQSLYYVANPEVVWGSGDIYNVALADRASPRKVLSEETTWSARPEPSPDGHRILYSSYRGRQWHQLWLTTPSGAAPLPLTFGEFDRRNARWSPDGRQVAYISNEHGGTELVVQQVVGGATTLVRATERLYRTERGMLEIDSRDDSGRALPVRVSVVASDQRAYAPDDAWMHADDSFDRSVQAIETHYFHCAGACAVSLPAGPAKVTVRRGFRYTPRELTVRIDPGRPARLAPSLELNALPDGFGQWLSADLHVHMNYGGHYRNTPEHLKQQARAEDLDVVHDLIVNKEERVPDIAYFRTGVDPAGGDDVLLLHEQEYHTSYWGHLGLLHLGDHYVLPDFASYRHTAFASPYPYNGVIADIVHGQSGLVGYVHPYDVEVVPEKDASLTHGLPADVAHGKVDYLEVMGFSDHRITAGVWYRLLNLGFRLPAGAGTDAMANYASLRGPVGLVRVFLDTQGTRSAAALREALKNGRGFVSNGPLLGLVVGDARPGGTVQPDKAGALPARIAVRSPVAVDHLELVVNGQVARTFKLSGDRRSLDWYGTIDLPGSGWVLLRAWNDKADPNVLDLYPYATTNPVYIEAPEPAPPAIDDARYFVAWLDRMIDAADARDDYNTAQERADTLHYLREARERYVELARGAAQGPKQP
jgi:hypothetical protein